jgi:hypothetical protein
MMMKDKIKGYPPLEGNLGGGFQYGKLLNSA